MSRPTCEICCCDVNDDAGVYSYHDWLRAAGWADPERCPWNLRAEWAACEDPKLYSPGEMELRSNTVGT